MNCISPGSISTEGLNVYPEEAAEHFAKSNPMRALGDVYDVAQGVVYLSADTAKFITGEKSTSLTSPKYDLVADCIGSGAMDRGEGPTVFRSNMPLLTE